MVGILMAGEVGRAMAGGTGTTTIDAAKACANRHDGHRIARARQGDHAAIGLMTGRTGVMDLGIATVDRIAAEGMAAATGAFALYHSCMSY